MIELGYYGPALTKSAIRKEINDEIRAVINNLRATKRIGTLTLAITYIHNIIISQGAPSEMAKIAKLARQLDDKQYNTRTIPSDNTAVDDLLAKHTAVEVCPPGKTNIIVQLTEFMLKKTESGLESESGESERESGLESESGESESERKRERECGESESKSKRLINRSESGMFNINLSESPNAQLNTYNRLKTGGGGGS